MIMDVTAQRRIVAAIGASSPRQILGNLSPNVTAKRECFSRSPGDHHCSPPVSKRSRTNSTSRSEYKTAEEQHSGDISKDNDLVRTSGPKEDILNSFSPATTILTFDTAMSKEPEATKPPHPENGAYDFASESSGYCFQAQGGVNSFRHGETHASMSSQAVKVKLQRRLASPRRTSSRSLTRSQITASSHSVCSGERFRTKGKTRVQQIKGAAGRTRSPTWSGLKKHSRTRHRPHTDNVSGASPIPRPQLSFSLPEDVHTELSLLLVEIEPPIGVLRIPLISEDDISAAKERVRDGADLVDTDLPVAAARLGRDKIGLLFQALLARGSQLDAGHPAEDPAHVSAHAVREGQEEPGCSTDPTAAAGPTMYAARDDRTAGEGLALDRIADVAVSLATRSARLVQLLRIKIEDDGDLKQASKTLRDIGQFFNRLDVLCAASSVSVQQALAEMRAT
eukprot:m.357887 g.357887  ORF g.357887 m.357887 type:complete len:452 (+) comp20757_c0_seq3:245-1600(+)